MERTYRNITYLFVAVLLTVLAGFWKTYFGLISAVSQWAGFLRAGTAGTGLDVVSNGAEDCTIFSNTLKFNSNQFPK